MKKKIIKFIVISIITTLVLVIISPIRGYCGMKYSSCVGFVVFFILFLFLKKKMGHILSLEQILLAMLAGYLIPDCSVRLPDFKNCLVSFPDMLMNVNGIFCSYITCRFLINKKSKYIPFLIGFGICLFLFFEGYPLYFQKLYHGTYTGACQVKCPLPLIFETPEGEQLTLNEREGYVLLYYWNGYCGACFRSFPELQKMFEEKPDNVRIFAVHWAKDLQLSTHTADLIAAYNFPVALTTFSTTPLKVEKVPTIFLIDMKNEQVIFEGDLKYAKRLIQKLQ